MNIPEPRAKINMRRSLSNKALVSPSREAIKTARRASGLTQTKAAALIGFKLSAWQRWEDGSRAMRPALWQLWNERVRAASGNMRVKP